MEVACEFQDEFWTVHNKSKKLYTCIVLKADISEPGQKITKFIGTHLEGKDNSDVIAIVFSCTKVVYFPRGMEKHFPFLRFVKIRGCGLKQISKRDLSGLPNLSELYLGYNELTSLPDDLFTEMTRLTDISFIFNKIEFASSKLLRPFIGRPNLHISLQRNTKIDAFFDETVNWSVKTLEALMELIDEKCLQPKPTEQINSEYFFVSGRYSDVNVITDSKTFKAHKIILAMKSSVFATILENNPEVTQMKIPDFNETSVNALLSFIYTGKIQDDTNPYESYSIAVKFKVEDMIAAYEDLLLDRLDDSNALETFEFAHLYSNNNLKVEAFSIISKWFPKQPQANLMENPDRLKELIETRSKYLDLLG